jgi:hypothetical protein
MTKDSFGRAKVGSGKRFANCVASMAHKKGIYDAKAVCATIAKHKYGKVRVAKMAAKGRQRRRR